MAIDKRFGEYENEHIFQKALFADDDAKAFLNNMGIFRDMSANRMNLFSNEAWVFSKRRVRIHAHVC